jgi:FtsZ-binding cell division protein ZapB
VQDINAILLEFKELKEVWDQLKDETSAREIGWQALSQEHNSILDKVDHLEYSFLRSSKRWT